MSPQILHLFGPLYINVYGLFIALGVLTGLIVSSQDKKLLKAINYDSLLSFLLYTILAAIIGGRLLFALENWNDLPSLLFIIQLWKPGYSILGSVAFATSFSYWYLKINQFDPMNILDRLALYIPLVQSIARLGCYFAGCCYGIQTSLPWAAIYTHPDNLAPLFTPVHPTQLYSSLLLFLLFITLYSVQDRFKNKGQLLGLYLIGSGFERFIVDFLRADRRLIMDIFSATQYIALLIISVGLLFFLKEHYAKRTR